MTTRAEHSVWCKERAWKAYFYYLEQGLTWGEVLRNTLASMLSDLGKHDETRKMEQIAFMLALTVKDEVSLRAFIDGFN